MTKIRGLIMLPKSDEYDANISPSLEVKRKGMKTVSIEEIRALLF
jgi:hypothetical protein